MRNGNRLLVLNKPYQTLCQFASVPGHTTLADFVNVPDVDVVGPLDAETEGLVLLTNMGLFHHLVGDPLYRMPKTYWVQVIGRPDASALVTLATGVELQDGLTLPARVRVMPAPELWPRTPPLDDATEHMTWLALTVVEERVRQVPRMTAQVGLRTVRLVRSSIGPWQLGVLDPGQWKEVRAPRTQQDLRKLLQRHAVDL